MNKATGEGATTFSESLSSKTDSELIADKKQFDALQKEIEYYNQKLMENETVYAPILKELVDKYQMLAAGGRRIKSSTVFLYLPIDKSKDKCYNKDRNKER